MEEYKAIMKLIDNKLEEQECIINHYRKESDKKDVYIEELTHKNLVLKEKIDGFEKEKEEILQVIQAEEAENKQLREEIEQLKETIEHLKKQLNDF